MDELSTRESRDTGPRTVADVAQHNGRHSAVASAHTNGGEARRQYQLLERRQYGSMSLKRFVGPNLLRGFAVSVIVHALALLAPLVWIVFRPAPTTTKERVVVLDMSHVTTVPPAREVKEALTEGSGGGSEMESPRLAPPARETREIRGSARNFLRESAAHPRAFVSVEMQPSALFSGSDRDGVEPVRRSDSNEGVRGVRDFSGTRGAALGGNGDGPEIGGTDLGRVRNGMGDGLGNGHGRGSRLGDGMGRGEPKLGGGSISAPTLGGDAGTPRLAVVRVPATPAEVNMNYDRNPLIEWIEQNSAPLPRVLQTPENLDQKPGDVTTWVQFTDAEGNQYAMYLLGRRSQPSQLNLFLVTNGTGTLLQDQGAKGASEVFKFGKVTGNGSDLAVQLQQLPPGRREARAMMAVFNAWWKQAQRSGR